MSFIFTIPAVVAFRIGCSFELHGFGYLLCRLSTDFDVRTNCGEEGEDEADRMCCLPATAGDAVNCNDAS
jgi:hypothetical protein